MLTPRNIVLITVALALAALFARLGFWQLDRHAERAAADRNRTERAELPPLEWTRAGDVPEDTSGTVGRRVRLRGSWAVEHEVILRSRSSDGRAGVEVLTPLLVGDEEPAVLVLRGWLPAADGLNADLRAGWPEDGSGDRAADGEGGGARPAADQEGVLFSTRPGRGGRPLRVNVGGRQHIALGAIDLELISESLPIRISPHVVRADDPPLDAAPLRPARSLQTGSGPHLPYAIQWFAFALISLVGTGLLLRKERRR